MKKTIIQISILLLFSFSFLQAEEAIENEIIQLDGKISVSQESDRWLKVTVPFLIKQHPEILKLEGKRPETIEELFNPEFLENLRIKVWISFLNEFKLAAIRGDRKDPRFFDYYSAELECMVLEIDRKTKKAEFLFPAAVAKKNELGNYPKLTGYVIEFSSNGEVFKVSEQIEFLNYDKEEYLERYRMEAINTSTANEGVLIPAYQISDDYLRELGPVVRD